jgi:L-serine dehydratase
MYYEMAEKSSIFDMIGPVMIGPSSSHTAGVVKIGLVARRILGEEPTNAAITFYNSFARTYEGHGSDRAILAGLMGFETDDMRIRDSFAMAKDAKLEYSMKSVGNASTLHPNSVKIELKGATRSTEVIGESLGGGVINIVKVNGFTANVTGNLHTIMIIAEDRQGAIAFIADVLAHDDCNIATMTVSRKGKNDQACHFIEMDTPMRPITREYIQSISWIKDVVYLEPQVK